MKTCLITGGARGIGYGLCTYFAEKGYTVFSFDSVKHSFESQNIMSFQVDITKENEIANAFLAINNQGFYVDILINNAGISHFQKAIQDVEIAEYDRVMNTNIRGAYLMAQHYVKQYKAQNIIPKYGRIINIASTRYLQNEKDWDIYGASKGALVSFTASLCVSLSNTGITVNSISPGWIETGDYATLSATDHSQHPSNRVGKVEDVARLCYFICQEENDFLNGANIPLDGGMTKRMIYFE